MVSTGAQRIGGVNPANLVIRAGFLLAPAVVRRARGAAGEGGVPAPAAVAPHAGHGLTPSEDVVIPAGGEVPWPGRDSPVAVQRTGRPDADHDGANCCHEAAGDGRRA